ncbi:MULTISPECIES: TetR/AcrR family transcriptional regulator [unclassified Nocardioides]|uniref:TetR/AcrR family transcriptional regulator n=1 Tax=unclassified Nocardioides TaxID=2615069 RepID=UPI00361D20FD
MAVPSGIYRGVSAEERMAERRARLMEATLAVWADPETRTTMTGICAEAGLTERYFYESFRNLDEALAAVLDAIAVEIEERTTRAAEAVTGDPAEQVLASVREFVDLLLEDPRKGRVAIIEAAALPALRARRAELLHHFAHRSSEVSRELWGARHGERDDEIAGALFIGGMAELITRWLTGSLEATPDEIVDVAARSFLGLYS